MKVRNAYCETNRGNVDSGRSEVGSVQRVGSTTGCHVLGSTGRKALGISVCSIDDGLLLNVGAAIDSTLLYDGCVCSAVRDGTTSGESDADGDGVGGCCDEEGLRNPFLNDEELRLRVDSENGCRAGTTESIEVGNWKWI